MGAGLLACSSVTTIHTSAERVEVNSVYDHENRIDSIVQPYKKDLEKEMLEVIAHADHDFTKGRPNGTLNNWATDALLDNQLRTSKGQRQVMSLLNVGGLRNPISKGDVTVGDIFKLMPFDNNVVWVEMPIEVLPEIEAYLRKRGGEPVGMVKIEKGKIRFLDPISNSKTFWIITSDYLMNGGDNMSFFEKKVSFENDGVLLRDVFLEEVKMQKVLRYNNEERITFE
jgi:2',3'-cyclic-nucleotide 2'-phosphodiesterase (5'-nucleotidase family)